jgi:DNA-binding Lrp family transcriptional regulator
MPRVSGAKMMEQRVRVLDLYEQDPTPSYDSIARTLGLSKATVQSIIKRFAGATDKEVCTVRNNRKEVAKKGPTKRFKRCVSS